MQPNHPLAVAVRMVDDIADAKGYTETFKEIGLDPEDVEHMANQRAIRLWLLLTGGEPLLKSWTEGAALPTMTRTDQEMIAALSTMCAASIALGWTARSVSDGFLLNDDTHWR